MFKTHDIAGEGDYQSCVCCSLKIWDAEDLVASYSFSYAHTDVITSTDVKPSCSSTLVSVSLDNESLLWDVRRAKPAKCIYCFTFCLISLLQICYNFPFPSFKGIYKDNCPLTAVSWNTTLDHLIAIGTANGSIVLIDLRKTEIPLYESVECDRSVHKLLFNPNPER